MFLVTAQAGGITAITKMPSCNIMLLGAQKKTLQGFSKLQMLPHTGFIFYAKVVQDLPPEFRRKAAKLVAAKLTLAARVDCFHEAAGGDVGKKLLEQIYEKFDKWQEPPPSKQTKVKLDDYIFQVLTQHSSYRLCPFHLKRREKSEGVAVPVK